MPGNDETLIARNAPSPGVARHQAKSKYRLGHAIAVAIFRLGIVAAIVGVAATLIFAFPLFDESGTAPNHAGLAHIGGVITSASIAISGLLSALMGQLVIAVFDMSRHTQNKS